VDISEQNAGGLVVVHEVEGLAERVQHAALRRRYTGADGWGDPKMAAAIHSGGEAVYRLAMAGLLCDAVRQVHASIGLDVVEAPEYEALGLPLVLSPIAGLPLVTHLHSGSAIGRRGNDLPATAADMAIDALEFAAVMGVDAVCAPSEAVVRLTKSFAPFERAVEILPLPFAWDGAKAFAAPPEDGPVVFVGRLERLKGADLLALALPAFLTQWQTARVEIIGPDTQTAPGGGSMRQWMERTIGPKFSERVFFRGQQDKAFVEAALNSASFCVIPSRFENFPYTCCEAMALGRTAIVSAETGAEEVVGKAGLAFAHGSARDLAERMVCLWGDRETLQRLSRLAYQWAGELMSPVATIQKRAAMYEQVIAQHRGARTAEDSVAQLPAPYREILSAPGRLEFLRAVAAGQLPARADTWSAASGDTPGRRLLAIMKELAGRSPEGAKVLLYGAGRYTSRLMAEKYLWESAGHAVVGVVDDDPRFAAGGTHLGLPVVSRTALENKARAGESIAPIVLSTDTFQTQFWLNTAELRSLGVAVVLLQDTR
jgi:glycosyltransferase involved in cell wall biosynthesis